MAVLGEQVLLSCLSIVSDNNPGKLGPSDNYSVVLGNALASQENGYGDDEINLMVVSCANNQNITQFKTITSIIRL